MKRMAPLSMRMTLFCPPARQRDQVSLLVSCQVVGCFGRCFQRNVVQGEDNTEVGWKMDKFMESSSVYFEESEMATARRTRIGQSKEVSLH
jgi:hypothetical protein